MPTTPKGLPYPDGETLLSEIDLSIKALAEAVDGQLGGSTVDRRLGEFTTGTHVVGTVLTTSVTFAQPFPVGVVPVVFLSIQASGSPHQYDYAPNAVSRTGFDCRSIRHSGTGGLIIAYFAIAPA